MMHIHHLFISPGHNYFGVRFAGVEECKPCYWMNQTLGDARAENWLKGRGGLRARVLTDGILQRDQCKLTNQ